MSGGLVTAAYIVAAILFIFSLAGLSKHETSQQGNYFGIAGMAIALIAAAWAYLKQDSFLFDDRIKQV